MEEVETCNGKALSGGLGGAATSHPGRAAQAVETSLVASRGPAEEAPDN